MCKILKQRKFWLDHYRDEKYQKIRELILDSFKDLIFDEKPHKYYLYGKEYPSVSHITHLFKPEFDTTAMAQATHDRNYFNPNSKYYKMSVDDIKKEWKRISDDACNTGSDRHNFGESVFWWMVGEYDKIVEEFKDRFTEDENGDKIVTAKYPKEEAILNFWGDLPDSYIPILAENKVFNINEFYGYSGTFDILFYYDATLNENDENKSGLLCLDYKTNADLYKNFKSQTLLAPFDELLDNPLNIYKLQLAAYQLAIEKIGLKVLGRRLIWLKPNATYEKIPLEDLSMRLDSALKALKNNN